jgi:hypothetical protein
MRTALFSVITQRVVVISYRRFGTTYRSRPHCSRIQNKACIPRYGVYIGKGVGGVVDAVYFTRAPQTASLSHRKHASPGYPVRAALLRTAKETYSVLNRRLLSLMEYITMCEKLLIK